MALSDIDAALRCFCVAGVALMALPGPVWAPWAFAWQTWHWVNLGLRSIRSCFAARYLSEILRGHRAGERKTEVAFTDRLSLRSVRAAFDPTWEEILASRRSRQGRSTCILWFT